MLSMLGPKGVPSLSGLEANPPLLDAPKSKPSSHIKQAKISLDDMRMTPLKLGERQRRALKVVVELFKHSGGIEGHKGLGKGETNHQAILHEDGPGFFKPGPCLVQEVVMRRLELDAQATGKVQAESTPPF